MSDINETNYDAIARSAQGSANRQGGEAEVALINLENAKIEKDAKDEELKQTKLGTRNIEQDINLRRQYAKWIFIMMCLWFTIIFLQGFDACFELTDTVLVALITTTTANVAAYFLGVIRYLFPANNKSK